MEFKCPVCDQNASNKCSNCHLICYCSKEHQKAHWKIHKVDCKPVVVKEDKILGRHLVAAKNIKEFQIVFKEKPLIVGPPQTTAPICLGCCQELTETNSRPCDRCGWPVCGPHCQESPHHRPECDLTVARGNKVNIQTFGTPHPNYQSILVVRCLYQKKYFPVIWDKLMALESHCDHRKRTEKWKSDQVQIAQFINRFYKLGNEFSEDDILKVCGIIQVNGHEVPLTEPPFVAIYDMTSMVEHNCRANCSKSFSSRGEVLLIAAADIPAGENLSICYTDPLWGTSNRRHHLYETKFFHCTCNRCSDVTDLGTMLSALRCQKENCSGCLLPKTFLTEDADVMENSLNAQLNSIEINQSNKSDKIIKPNGELLNENYSYDGNVTKNKEFEIGEKVLNENGSKNAGGIHLNGNTSNATVEMSKANEKTLTNWFCDKCGGSVTEKYVYTLIEHVGRDLDAMEKGDCDSCLRFLKHYGKYLHHNHYYMVDVTLAMVQLIGQEQKSCLQIVPDEKLDLKVETCKQMVEFLEKLVPAELRARGGVLFELHAAVAETGRRKAARTGEGPGILIKYLMESKDILEKSIKLLEHEPEELPEGKIAKQAKVNHRDMETMISNLFAMDSQIL